jgi:hypothetical protein
MNVAMSFDVLAKATEGANVGRFRDITRKGRIAANSLVYPLSGFSLPFFGVQCDTDIRAECACRLDRKDGDAPRRPAGNASPVGR